MNPEFQRNLWLEATPRRMIAMAVVLALVFFAAALSNGTATGPGEAARWAYYAIVVIWGARRAALSVAGEVRGRTWDGQLLSALGGGTMMWGKLFGSTIYNWFGGAICLAVIMVDLLGHRGPQVALNELVYYIAIGVIAQAVSLLACLFGSAHRFAHTQFEIFLYQLAGIAAAVAVYFAWAPADPAGFVFARHVPIGSIVWWDRACGPQAFLLCSFVAFAGWAVVGCASQMRLELKMRNGPFVWLAFLVFIGLYVAGFDSWLSVSRNFAYFDPAARHLLLAGAAFGALAYVMIFLEPKGHARFDRPAFGKVRLGRALAGAPGWMSSCVAAFVVGIALINWLGQSSLAGDQAVVGAALGFLARDMAIIVLLNMHLRRRGDIAALAVLFALYALLPAIVSGLKFDTGLAVFFPRPVDPVWLSPLAAWVEAVLAMGLALGRVVLPGGEA